MNKSNGVVKEADGSFSLYLPTQSSSSNNEAELSFSDPQPSPSILNKQFLPHSFVSQNNSNSPASFQSPPASSFHSSFNPPSASFSTGSAKHSFPPHQNLMKPPPSRPPTRTKGATWDPYKKRFFKARTTPFHSSNKSSKRRSIVPPPQPSKRSHTIRVPRSKAQLLSPTSLLAKCSSCIDENDDRF